MKSVIIPLILLWVLIIFGNCNKDGYSPDEKATIMCQMNCVNGSCNESHTCDCKEGWSGWQCDSYFTDAYLGMYVSTNYNCGLKDTTVQMLVQRGGEKQIIIGGVYCDMTDLTNFKISPWGVRNLSGSGSIDGKTMTIIYTDKSAGQPTITCGGNFIKK